MIPPYRIPLFTELARRFNFTLIVDCLQNKGRQWKLEDDELGFEYVVMNGKFITFKRKRDDVGYAESRSFHLSYGCMSLLRQYDPEVVVSCEFGMKTIWSILYCKLYRKKLLLWSEGTMHTEGNTTWGRRLIRPFLVRAVDGFWTNGPESRILLEHYGAKPNTVFEGLTGVDTVWWKDEGQRLRQTRESIRNQLGLEGLTFVFNGTITPRKGIREMMEAFDRWQYGKPCNLIILGSGILEEFAAADWALLPTLDDNWPLATLEVLVSGLPQMFSIYNGGTSDLCLDGETGYSFDPLDIDDFVRALSLAAENPNLNISIETINYFSEFYSPINQAKRAENSVCEVMSQ